MTIITTWACDGGSTRFETAPKGGSRAASSLEKAVIMSENDLLGGEGNSRLGTALGQIESTRKYLGSSTRTKTLILTAEGSKIWRFWDT